MIEANEHTRENESLILAASVSAPYINKLVIRELRVLVHNTDNKDDNVINLNEVLSSLSELEVWRLKLFI